MRAAAYLRSSKDRSDVSIDAQRRALGELAKARQLHLVAEFADAVESGKDDDRPGFQSLLQAIRNPRRGWDTILVLDTSRVARRRHLAIIFEEVECKKHGVRVVYKSLPDSDPITEMLLKSILQALDEWHSLTSREKGLAGMRENVKKGFRAGGRAPMGYRLESVETGAIRDGVAVRKSRLVLAPEAAAVRDFMRARAEGVPRGRAGLPQVSDTSKVGLEWNALTYAGHTVWNVHAEAGSGRKRRPRSEWVIQRDTHDALITDAQADVILARLEAYTPARARQRENGYLLTGLLVTPDGKPFHGDRGTYRAPGRSVQADVVEHWTLKTVLASLRSSQLVRDVARAARALQPLADDSAQLRGELASLEKRIGKLLALVEQTAEPGPLLRQMETLERERASVSGLLATADQRAAERRAIAGISEHEIRRLLVQRAEAIEDADPAAMRDALTGLVERIELDGSQLRIRYRIGRDKVASPRGSEPIPVEVVANIA